MKIFEKKRLTSTTNVCVGFKCNFCATKSDSSPALEANVVGHFSSPVLSDCISYEFDLCESCIALLFTKFDIKPLVRQVSPFDGEEICHVDTEAELKRIELRRKYEQRFKKRNRNKE